MPHSNGISECKNSTIVKKARSMIQTIWTSKFLWVEAVNTTNHIVYISWTSSNSSITLNGGFSQIVSSISHLCVWGCLPHVHVKKKHRLKLDAKSEAGILIGYGNEIKGYRIYSLNKCKVKISIWIKEMSSLVDRLQNIYSPMLNPSCPIHFW